MKAAKVCCEWMTVVANNFVLGCVGDIVNQNGLIPHSYLSCCLNLVLSSFDNNNRVMSLRLEMNVPSAMVVLHNEKHTSRSQL